MKWRLHLPRRLPWKTRAQLADVVRLLTDELTDRERRIGELCTTADADQQTIAFLEAELRRLAGTEHTAMLSTHKPDWVLVGIPRPGRGVRVWASRELAGTAFDMTPMDQPPPRWKITATMQQALTVDEPGYAPAMAKISEIWANWDRDAAREAGGRKAREHGGWTDIGRTESGMALQMAPLGTPLPPAIMPDGGDDDGEQESGRA